LVALDRKRLLAAKGTLGPREKQELADLTIEIGGLDATLTLRDPLYQRFVTAMTVLGYKRHLMSATPSVEQRRDQQKMAEEVLAGMLKK